MDFLLFLVGAVLLVGGLWAFLWHQTHARSTLLAQAKTFHRPGRLFLAKFLVLAILTGGVLLTIFGAARVLEIL